MLHSRKLQYIDEIVRCGSIRKAAARLNVASSAVNRQILAIEEEFGAPIFERLPRGLKLTAAGELCIEHIREVLKDYERLETRIRGLKMPQAGKVTMVATTGLAAGPLTAILHNFLEKHPRVRVLLHNDSGTPTVNPVLTGEADIGLGFNIPAAPGLRTLALFDVPVGVVLPPDHPLAERQSLDLTDIVHEKMVLSQPGTSLRNVINLVLAPLPMQVEPLLETNSVELMKQLVRSGSGLTLLNPLDVYLECKRGELVFRPFSTPHMRHQPMKLFARSRSTLDTAASLYVEFLLSELSALVADLQKQGHVPLQDKQREQAG
ncbi:LysR family transcriptional regulator [Agrobacterium tumefaciens]|uniref:LysR family transcriptional regulator n=1 Tax=Agrobacterium tumefaciens TaxID=358 RepID=UPI0021CFE66A|nr:LysR family transcriptional regulator [Agrobacterium tumefaciens]UXS02324.1 LysR family transcriptional regulator [Agrobacterium tumefaciens]